MMPFIDGMIIGGIIALLYEIYRNVKIMFGDEDEA